MNSESDGVAEYFARFNEQGEAAEAFVAMLRARGELKSHISVTYRCELRGCVLLQILTTRQGLMFRKPAYRLSPDENAVSSSPAGRAKNTRDGDRRWKESVGLLSHAMNLSLDCDHVRQCVVTNERIEADVAARHAKVKVPTGVKSL